MLVTTKLAALSSIGMFYNFCQEIMAVLGTRIRKCLTFCAMPKKSDIFWFLCPKPPWSLGKNGPTYRWNLLRRALLFPASGFSRLSQYLFLFFSVMHWFWLEWYCICCGHDKFDLIITEKLVLWSRHMLSDVDWFDLKHQCVHYSFFTSHEILYLPILIGLIWK